MDSLKKELLNTKDFQQTSFHQKIFVSRLLLLFTRKEQNLAHLVDSLCRTILMLQCTKDLLSVYYRRQSYKTRLDTDRNGLIGKLDASLQNVSNLLITYVKSAEQPYATQKPKIVFEIFTSFVTAMLLKSNTASLSNFVSK